MKLYDSISLLLLCCTVHPVVGQISNLILINADTSTPITNLTNGTIINIATSVTSNFNIQAATMNNDIQSIRFALNNVRSFRVESSAPFALCGNNQDMYFTCPNLTIGTHTVTATPYSGIRASGVVGMKVQVQFQIINAPPVPEATKSPTKAPILVVTNSPTMAPMTQIPTKAPKAVTTKSPTNAPTTIMNCTIPKV